MPNQPKRKCETCQVEVHPNSWDRHLRSKKHQDKNKIPIPAEIRNEHTSTPVAQIFAPRPSNVNNIRTYSKFFVKVPCVVDVA